MKINNTLTGLLLGFCTTLYANVNTGFDQEFNKLVKQYLPNTAIGLIVQDPKTGMVLFEHHAEDNFYPASNTKLFTAAAALKFFGPNFQYQTSINAPLEKIKEGTLEDNVYVIFRGDPSFSSTDLANLVKQLKAKGVNKIKGNIIIDDFAFDDVPYAPGWTWDSIPYAYSAPVTSIIINTNKVRVKLNKAENLNDKVKIEQADEAPLFSLNTNVSAVTLDESEHSCQLHARVKNNEISLNGCWPIDKTPTVLELAIDNPRLLAKNLLKSNLQENQIELTGDISFNKAPKNVPVLLTKRSAPLKVLLKQVLAESNNIYTESLTKALGLAFLGQGSFQVGIHAIEEILTKDTKIDFTQINLSDGSGQSRYNLVSPYLVGQLLYHMYQDPQFSVYYNALSTAGKNGSLADRMKSKEMVGKVVAKTGSALGTSALSGYFTANNGDQYLFSMLINQSLNDNSARKSFEDKLCQVMVTHPWPQTKALPAPSQTPTAVNTKSKVPLSKVTAIPL
ncbi:MAG: D-alanyl-D-alanine carboxypeptidase/D-alanyl-D-alanine-endopeptidase [Proteobacteria bacterium]|nr:D-alanyl-D-alanine carboxypeptidase/D-alanyl-D-alanine-endopeptidase [Pseudomonadota bacterium]